MAELIAGIDLGTSNSVISVVIDGTPVVIPDRRGNTIHPSVVFFPQQGGTIIGNEAVPYLAMQPERTVFSAKRLMGRTINSPEIDILRGSFPFELRGSGNAPDAPARIVIDQAYHPPEGIGARVLNYLKGLADEYVGEEIKKVVITVPANFDEGQRQATMQAGQFAGFEVLQLVNEPTAAALAYGYDRNKRERIAVYDFGGGTFDITILEVRNHVYEVLGTAGRSYLGGDDFDLLIVDEIIYEFERTNNVQFNQSYDPIRYPLKSIAQEIKHKLSTSDTVQESIRVQIPGTLNNFVVDFSLSRHRFEEMARDQIARSISTCEEALRLANLQPAQIEHLVMVGGSTRVPMVRQAAERFFNRSSESNVNPDEVVAIGAAIYGASLVSRPTVPNLPPRPGAGGKPPLPPIPGNRPPVPGGGGGPGFGPPGLRGGPGTSQFGQQSGFNTSQFGQSSFGHSGAPGLGNATSSFASNSPAAPLLIDVTPHALGIETIGGIMDTLIEQNAALPLSRQRTFVASRDNQTEVIIPIFAGSSRHTKDNRRLGTIELRNIAPGLREDVQINVSFEINTSGILSVKATDLRTGAAQSAKLSISGVSSDNYDASNTLASHS